MRERGRRARAGRRRGTVLVVAMWIIVVLAGMVLVFGRSMRVEALAAANRLAANQAEWVARGALAFLMAEVDGTDGTLRPGEGISCEAVPVGGGYFWLLLPDPEGSSSTAFGIGDEAGKLNLNAATADMLLGLPGMTDELAASIVDWRSPDAAATAGGAKSEYYLLLDPPYLCKSGPLESIEEVLLVKGASLDILFGEDANRNGVLDANESDGDASLPADNGDTTLDPGIAEFVTVSSSEANVATAAGDLINVNNPTGPPLVSLLQGTVASDRFFSVLERVRRGRPFRNLLDFYARSGLTVDEFRAVADRLTVGGQPRTTGLINVNTAPRQVLACLPLETADVDALIAARQAPEANLASIAWVAAALPPDRAADVGDWVTVRSFQFSADIVAVSGSGRAFKRYRAVLDARSSPPRVLAWQDLSGLGWPLDPSILTALRSGQGLEQGIVVTAGGGSPGMSGGGF